MRRSPMPARKTPLQRAPMKRALRPSMPVLDGPAPKKKRRGKSSQQYLSARARSFGLSGGVCVICRSARADHGHHRLRQGQGGPDTAENVMPVCWRCHQRVHSTDLTLALAAGWLLRSHVTEITPWWELPFWTERRAA